MGSFADFNQKRTAWPKVESPRLKEIEQAFFESGGLWENYRIGELFEKLDLRFKKDKFDKDNDVSKIRSEEFNLPLVNAKNGDNGIMYYGRSSDFDSAEMTIDIVNDGAVSTGNVYPQPQKTGVLYNAYLIQCKYPVTKNLLCFFSSCIQKSIKLKFGYENKAGWEKVKKEEIQLPTQNGKIDFDFMEKFIAELKALRVAELHAYLQVTGLSNYTLSNDEQAALSAIKTVEWRIFNVVDVFNVKNTFNILSRDIVENSGNVPYLSASRENNAISSYISYDERFLDKGNCIFIGGKTFVVTYQEQDFYSNDSHNLCLYLKETEKLNKLNQFFMISCLEKSLSYQYSWGNSISNKKIQKNQFLLPTKNGEIDYEFMEILISAIQKLVIKDVVDWADREISATETVINNH